MTARRYLPALLLLFVGSGCAALIYEVVWFQLLQLTIGSSAVSLGVLLGTFMGGMCLGSILLPRWISAVASSAQGLRVPRARHRSDRHPRAVRDAGVDGHLHVDCRHRLIGILLRGLAAAICLLPPTLLMGATLPAMARWVKTTPEGVSWLGFFYGGNIAGAVLGSLTAGFYLLRVHDMLVATFAAVALNVLVAAIALVISRTAPYEVAVEQTRRRRAAERRLGHLRRHRHFRHDRAVGGSHLDAHPLAALRRHRLHLRADPRGVPLRPRHRQQRRLGAGAQHGAAAPGAGLGADAARGRHCLVGVHAHAVAAVLADRSVDVEQPVVHVPARSGALAVGDAAGRHSLGRQLSPGARLGRQRPPGSGAARRQRLRRQYHRRDRRFALGQPAAGRLAGQPERPAAADRAVGDGVAPRTRRGIVGSLRNGAVARQDAPRQHAADRRRRDARGLARAQRRRGPGHPRRLRPLRGQPHRPGGRHRHARRLERLDRRHPALQRRAQLPQRRQGAGLERAAGHAPAAHARAHDDADSAGSEARAGRSASVPASPPAPCRSSRGSSR